MAEIRKVVKQVLSQLGASREARHYLGQFSGTDSMRFAVVKVGGGVIEEQLEALASALAFLRNLGLMPIILQGGPRSMRRLKKIDRYRNTITGDDPDVMEICSGYYVRIAVVTAPEEQECAQEFSTGVRV
jgi:acetylglutamate kinase